MTKTVKRLKAVTVTKSDGFTTMWTRELDRAHEVQLTESNTLMVFDEDGNPLVAYSPLGWMRAESEYEDAEVAE